MRKPSRPIPARIGRYIVERELKCGAFGRVLLAYDPRVKRLVAIKVLLGPVEPATRKRFLAEACAAANLSHRNIVIIYELEGTTEEPHLVMEYLAGRDLSQVIFDGELGLLDKVEILSQIADALAYAHRHFVVHRDIKPTNIMILPDGTVKLVDFGIALLLDDTTRITRSGEFVGTLSYMAPEQLSGKTGGISTDVWSFGIVTHELLAGKHPFDSPGVVEMLFRICHEDAPPLSVGSTVLTQLVQRCLSRDPDRRYASFDDIRMMLQRLLWTLRKAAAAALVRDAEACCRDGQGGKAAEIVARILELDPGNVDGICLNDQLHDLQ